MPLTEADFNELRQRRNYFLSLTDPLMMLPDLPTDIKNDIKEYRTKLRDMSSKFGTEWTEPEHIDFPEYPNKLLSGPPPQ